MVAGAGLVVAGPALRAWGKTAAPAGSRRPGAGRRPYPDLPAGTDTLPQIDHIVVLMMENHSFDSYLGLLGRGDGYTLDARGVPTNSNPDASGKPVPVYHAPSTCQAGYDVSQSWDVSHRSWDQGRNDGFVKASSTHAMAYWTGDDLPFYWSLARTFPLCDRYFASTMAQTYPNRRFLIAGSAFGLVGDPLPGPLDPPPRASGYSTIMDALDDHSITWKDYFTDLPTVGLFPYVVRNNPGKVVPMADFFADAAAGTLPGFSIVDVEFFEGSEENPQDVRTGEFTASQVVRAVLQSPAWARTLLIWTYDEHGGYYDHVPPQRAVAPDSIPPAVPAGDTFGDLYTWTGFRVPAVVVSPWAKRGYVSSVVFDHTSILKLVETKWNLPALSDRDFHANNMLDCVDFSAPAPPFLVPPALADAPVPTGVPACIAQDPQGNIP